jgi:hypothetical protein
MGGKSNRPRRQFLGWISGEKARPQCGQTQRFGSHAYFGGTAWRPRWKIVERGVGKSVCEPMEERCEPSIRQTKAIAPEGGPLTPWKILCTVMFAFRAGVRIAPRGEDGYGKVGERGRLTQAGIDLRPLSLQGVGAFHATLVSTPEPASAAPRFPMATAGRP